MNLPILIFPPKVDELADVWSQFVETELRHECYDEALSYLKRATTAPGHKPSYFDRTESVQNRVLDIGGVVKLLRSRGLHSARSWFL